MNYYNENDPFAAAWLRDLIREGLIPFGYVDERSIIEVEPEFLLRWTQCHFFAGIAGWSEALRLAAWPEDRHVWTGSCPCQPFSSAGKRGGSLDARHLWPEFYRLIQVCRPATVFGEQVASKDGLLWLDGVRADLESSDYSFGAADLCAAGVGSPNIRQRLYWVAHTSSFRCDEQRGTAGSSLQGQCTKRGGEYARSEQAGGLPGGSERLCGDDRLGDTDLPSLYERPSIGEQPLCDEHHQVGRVGDTDKQRLQGLDERGDSPGERSARSAGLGFWADFDIIHCTDGKARRTQSGICPLAHGVPHRMVKLRGLGNAINPILASEFICATEEARLAVDLIG